MRGRDFVALRWAGINVDRNAIGEQRHVGVGNPVGRGDDALVARIQDRGADVETSLLGAGRDDDLRTLIAQAVVALELGDDRVLEFGSAVDRGIARDALSNRIDARVGDICRCVEVGLAGAEADYVMTLRLELGGAGGDRECGRGFDLLNAL